MNIDKLMAGIRKVKPGQYDCKSTDFLAICDASGGGMEAAANCFNFGFIQGQKAAKAETNRERKQLMERDASGWYSYLSVWIKRNLEDVELMRMLGIRARALEDAMRKKREREEATTHD